MSNSGQFVKGQKAWNKGIHITIPKCPEGCECNKHKKPKCQPGCECNRHSETVRNNISVKHLGLKQSEETKGKISQTLTGHIGISHSEETRKRISVTLTGRKQTPESIQKRRNSYPGKPVGMTGKKHSEETKEFMKSLWNKERREKARDWAASQRISRPTIIEIILQELLSNMYGPDFVVSEYPLLTYSIDCAIPSLMLAFEADGEYWHRNKEDSDNIRDKKISEIGWKVIRFSERSLRTFGKVN